jgi:hypothetical protein
VRLRTEIGEGLRFVAAHPQQRALTIASATAAFFNSAVLAVEVLFFTRDLHLPARRRHRHRHRHRHHARAIRRWQRHQSINQGSRLTDP